MAVVGAFVRIDTDHPAGAVRARLAALEGVEPFDLDDAGKVGIVVEAEDLDGAHARITEAIPAVEGVLGVWPVYVHAECGPEAAASSR